MPKQSKSKSSETATATTESVVAEALAVSSTSVVSEKKPRKSKSSKTTQQTEQTTSSDVSTSVSVDQQESSTNVELQVAPVSEEVVSQQLGEDSEIMVQTAEFVTKLTQLSNLVASLKAEFKAIEKKYLREIKLAQKKSSKGKKKSGNRQPSGFVKPTKISDELAKFLDKPVGTEMARTDVTREINKYIRLHNLQDKENGRKINPDSKLQSLLKLKKSDELTYFNLQRYMSPHFSKVQKETTTA